MSTETRTQIVSLLREVCDQVYDGNQTEMALDWRVHPTNLSRWIRGEVVPTSYAYISLIAERTSRRPDEILAMAKAAKGKGCPGGERRPDLAVLKGLDQALRESALA